MTMVLVLRAADDAGEIADARSADARLADRPARHRPDARCRVAARSVG